MCVYLEGGYDFFLWGNHFLPLGQLLPYANKQVLLVHMMNPFLLKHKGGFPGSTVEKNLPANTGDTGSIPGPGRFHMPRSN